jgi:hypothetical protein
MWSYIYQAWLQQGSDIAAVALDSVDISVCFGPNIDPYFSISLLDPSVVWRKAWILQRNEADMPHPRFIGGHPISHPNWEFGVAQAYLHRWQPLLEII